MFFEEKVFDIIGVLKLLLLVTMDGRGAANGVAGVLLRFFGGNEIILGENPDGGTYPAAALARARIFSMSRSSTFDTELRETFSSNVESLLAFELSTQFLLEFGNNCSEDEHGLFFNRFPCSSNEDV